MLYQLSYVRAEPEDSAAAIAGAGGRPPPTNLAREPCFSAEGSVKRHEPGAIGRPSHRRPDRSTLAHCGASFYRRKGSGVRVGP